MGLIKEEDLMLFNIYTLKVKAPKYMKQLLTYLNREINKNTIMVGSFSTPLSTMDRSSRQKISKERLALNDTIDRMVLDIQIIPSKKSTEYTEHSLE